MIIWIIGASGSGKTFFAKKLYKHFIKKKSFLVDGDEVRKYLTYKLGYKKKDRFLNSKYIQDLCFYLEKKGFFVICAIQSIFPKHQKKNKKLFNRYIQIYLKSNLELIKSNKHKLKKFRRNVVGRDIVFPTPYKSDLIINNNFRNEKKILKEMIVVIKKKLKK